MKPVWSRLLGILLGLPCALSAHEGGGPAPSDAANVAANYDAAASVPRPRRLDGGQLYVPKALQHILGLRTEVFVAGPAATKISLTGEIVADPDSSGNVTAGQAGRVEPGPRGWLLPGTMVNAGETLAYLRPLLTLHEQAQRRAVLAQLDNDLQISEINVERLRLQAESNGAVENSGNVYYEQARLEWEGLKEKYRLESEALTARTAIQAPIHGVLMALHVQAGDAVIEAQPLFELADASRLRVAVKSFDPGLASHVQSAQLRGAEGDENAQSLILRGQEPLAGRQGWRLLFNAQTAPQKKRMPGEIVTVDLDLMQGSTGQLSMGCVAGVSGSGSAWVHVAPERFEQRMLPGCAIGKTGATQSVALSPGERVVTQGAALLSEYR